MFYYFSFNELSCLYIRLSDASSLSLPRTQTSSLSVYLKTDWKKNYLFISVLLFFFVLFWIFFLPSLSLSLLQFSISMCFQVSESHSQWSNRFEVCMPQEPRSHPLRVNSELFKFPQTKLIQRLFFLLSHQLDPVSAWMKVWFGIFWTRNFAPLQVVYQLQQLGSSSSLGGYLID